MKWNGVNVGDAIRANANILKAAAISNGIITFTRGDNTTSTVEVGSGGGDTTEFDKDSSTLSSNGGALGDIVKFGNTSTTAGGVYYLQSNSTWAFAQANATSTSTGVLAVALGTNSTTNGMLLRGFVNPFSASNITIGAPVYLEYAASGRFNGTPPSTSGQISRVIGHALASDVIYFNPSVEWIEL